MSIFNIIFESNSNIQIHCMICLVYIYIFLLYIYFELVVAVYGVCHLMQRPDDLARLLIDDLWPPVRVESCQACGQPVVFSHPERVQDRQGQDLVHPAVTGREALDPRRRLRAGLLETRRRPHGHEGQIRPTAIAVLTVHSQQTFSTGQVPQAFLQICRRAVDGGRVDEGRDWIHLLPLESDVCLNVNAGGGRTEKRKTASNAGQFIIFGNLWKRERNDCIGFAQIRLKLNALL